MHEVLVNPLGGLSLPGKSVVRLTDRPDMTLDVYCGCKTTNATTTAIIKVVPLVKLAKKVFGVLIHFTAFYVILMRSYNTCFFEKPDSDCIR